MVIFVVFYFTFGIVPFVLGLFVGKTMIRVSREGVRKNSIRIVHVVFLTYLFSDFFLTYYRSWDGEMSRALIWLFLVAPLLCFGLGIVHEILIKPILKPKLLKKLKEIEARYRTP
ncbi:MAG: hypothetical protein QG665_121 [Patescibacteria group bacterium]|nr:hypothetical protein [Patescibacteria group bacterium]